VPPSWAGRDHDPWSFAANLGTRATRRIIPIDDSTGSPFEIWSSLRAFVAHGDASRVGTRAARPLRALRPRLAKWDGVPHVDEAE